MKAGLDTSTAGPSPELVTRWVTLSIPETASVAVKSTSTAVVYQPLSPVGAEATTLSITTGAPRSSLTVTSLAALTWPAWSWQVPETVRPVVSTSTVTAGLQEATPLPVSPAG